MSNFWQGLGGKLTDQWVAILLTPAFAFWLGGLFAWLTHAGWNSLSILETQLNQLTPLVLITLLIVLFLIIVISSSLVQRLNFAMLRGLEGYWPAWLGWLADWCKDLQKPSQDKVKKSWDALEEKEQLSPEEEAAYIKLTQKLRSFPSDPDKRMPLPLGNILRATENRSWDKYGLDTIICWPRLWLILPESTQKEITQARATMDSAVLLVLWSFLFLIWTIWAWWAPLVTFLVALVAYYWAMSAARIHGDLLEAAFDLYRFALYEALRFPVPKNTSEEKKNGVQLTTYLLYGEVEDSVVFENPKQAK